MAVNQATIVLIISQVPFVLTRSNLSRYYARHCDNNGRKWNRILESQETPHFSPSRASYGVSIVRNVEKIDQEQLVSDDSIALHMASY